ncbi:MAG: hypothetical protein ACI9IP_002460 [Arcticibacterium sp.]|jgi:hypothetical protein
MKKKGTYLCYLLIVALFTVHSVQAQDEVLVAKKYLKEHLNEQKLSIQEIENLKVSSQYYSASSGLNHLYLKQTFEGIDVYNGMYNITSKDGEVLFLANSGIKNLKARIPSVDMKSIISPSVALQKAALPVNLELSKQLKRVSSVSLNDDVLKEVVFSDGQLSEENVVVKLFWFESNEKGNAGLHLVWEASIYQIGYKHNWSIKIDAVSGEILDTKDNVLHYPFGESTNQINAEIGKSARKEGKKMYNSVSTVFANTYRVFDYPLESPNHGSSSLVTSPYTKFAPAGTGPGDTNGWHHYGERVFDNYDYTKGNNVVAYQDTANDNTAVLSDFAPSSTDFIFDYSYTQGLKNGEVNQNAAITNLFYWNNLLHDVLWKYGFDEPAGNFQNDNLERGGAGGDAIFAEAQDGNFVNDASISTASDGGTVRMQISLRDDGIVYDPDGSFDNGVITHLYGSGWSSRLTGGPSTVSCLGNTESGLFGWNDYLALMMTTDWSSLSPSLASANLSRGIGTYFKEEATNGNGIRPYPYSYDMANVNPIVTYGQVANEEFTSPHGIGSIWATILWDMTWEIILEDNQIVDNIYDLPASVIDYRGNLAALKLVNEGLAMQACSPSFIDARDAILKADSTLFNGRYFCALSRAFARRGLGKDASTGISSSDRIVTEDFTPITTFLTSNVTPPAICSGLSFNYEALANNAPINATFSWTRPLVSGISNTAGAGFGAFINEVLINNTEEPITVNYIVTISEDLCGNAGAQRVSVDVNTGPIPLIGEYNVCQNGTVPSGEGLKTSPILTKYFEGDVVTGSTYNRSSSSNNSNIYSASGKLCYYTEISFVSPSNGSYAFETTGGSISDTYLSLYQNAFDPTNPEINFLRGDDDSGAGTLSKVTESLIAGNTYYLVVSTFNIGVIGSFALTSSVPVFSSTYTPSWTWHTLIEGGVVLGTDEVFNPVGVSGSGIPDTGTPITESYYLGEASYQACRRRVTFSINEPTINSGKIADTLVCKKGDQGILSLIGNIGSVKRWESSENDFVNTTTISNTTQSLTLNRVREDTKFRAVIQNGACPEKNSSTATVSVVKRNLTLSSPTDDVAEIDKTFAAIEDLTATNKLNSGAKVQMKAGLYIEFDAGFEAVQNSTFTAEIEDVCPND